MTPEFPSDDALADIELLHNVVEMNEALVLGAVRQNELTEAAERVIARLQREIATREQTARELAEKARLLDLTDDAIIVRNMEGVISYWNHGAEVLYGWSREEAMGKMSHTLLQTESSTPMEQIAEELERNGRWTGELVQSKRDGQRITVLVRKSLDRDSRGNPAAVLQSITDITERKRWEEALRASEASFHTMADAMPQLAWVARADGYIHWYNQRWYEYTGTTPQEMEGWGWQSVHDPQELPKVLERWMDCIASGEPFEMTFPLRGANGEFRRFLTRVLPLKDAAGRVTQWFGTNTDVEEQTRAEEELRASEERFRVLFDSGPVAIFSCDREAVIQAYNRRAAELWGREPVCGAGGERHCGSVKLFHADGRRLPHEESPILDVLCTGVIVKDAEVFIERPDGSRIAVIVTFAPLKDERGEITGAITAFYDITERRQLENTLVARAAELAQADRSKDEFLAMLAHELRNPLAPMRSAAEILKTEGASAEACALAQGILTRQIENMSQMIDDLLDVSRITEGKIELRPQVVALADVLNAAASLARPGIEARGQELTIALPAEPVFLHADATRLDQVFGNLLTNACKYSGSGCHISVTAEVVPAEDSSSPPEGEGRRLGGRGSGRLAEPREVIVRVRDDGIGIAPELLPRIFDLFVQATRSLDRAHGGLGIGLTLVHRLVKLHGGSVEARSAGLGHGSEFIVRLPILTAAAAAPTSPPAAPARDLARRILIVDDNQDSARSMAALQGLRGHTTRTAFTGPDAVAAAAEFAPDVVLLDIGLPGMDGYEVARQLRAMPALAGAFLVAISGYGSDEDRARARLAGFDEYLVKPADHNLLRTWMRARA